VLTRRPVAELPAIAPELVELVAPDEA